MVPHRQHHRKKARSNRRTNAAGGGGEAADERTNNEASADAAARQNAGGVAEAQPEQPPTVIEEFNINDVFSGRGPPMVHYEGNVRFRALIRKRRPEFASAARRRRKSAIAREILNTITQRGGRFLRQVESSLPPQDAAATAASASAAAAEDEEAGDYAGTRWVEMDTEAALVKIKQALRHKDTTAATSDRAGSLDISEKSSSAVGLDVSEGSLVLSSRPTSSVRQSNDTPAVASLEDSVHPAIQQQVLQQQQQQQQPQLVGTAPLTSNNLSWLLQQQQQLQQQQLFVPWQTTAATTFPQLGPLSPSQLNLLLSASAAQSNMNPMPLLNAAGISNEVGRSMAPPLSTLDILQALQQRAQTEANVWQLRAALLEQQLQQQPMALLHSTTTNGIGTSMDPIALTNTVLANSNVPNQALLMGSGLVSSSFLQPASLLPSEHSIAALSGLRTEHYFPANLLQQQLVGPTMTPTTAVEPGTITTTTPTRAPPPAAPATDAAARHTSITDNSAVTSNNNSNGSTSEDGEDNDESEEDDRKPAAREDAAATSSSESSTSSKTSNAVPPPPSKKRKAK